jgi:hypothetical protein
LPTPLPFEQPPLRPVPPVSLPRHPFHRRPSSHLALPVLPSPPPFTTAVKMSGRPKKKQAGPDESGGRSHYSRDFPALESPQRLAGTKKRSGPRSPAFKNPRPPAKEVDGFEGQPLQSRVLNYDAAPFVPGASSGAPSQAGVNARSSRQVEFNSPSNRYYELSAQSDDEDTEDSGSALSTSRTEDAVGLGVDASPSSPSCCC